MDRKTERNRFTVMAAYREGRPRTSVAWEHFDIKDRDKGIATCKYCHDSFSYRTSVSNLIKHLRYKHNYPVLKTNEDDDETDGESEEKSEKAKVHAEVWEYFTVKDEVEKLAKCSFCLEQYSFADTIEPLVRHLKAQHSIDFGKSISDDDKDLKEADEDDDEEKFDTSLSSEHRGRSRSSVAWEYFDIKDEKKMVASCKFCRALFSYRTSVSNLMKHARRKHNIGFKTSDEGEEGNDTHDVTDVEGSKCEDSPPQMLTRAQRSIVWLYFKCVDPDAKLSQCVICKKLLSHSTTLTNLKKHLARKHPNVKIPTTTQDGRKRVLLSSGGELYEVETGAKLEGDDDSVQDEDDNRSATLEMDTVFLEDFDQLEDEPSSKKRKLSKTKRQRLYSSSSEDEITFVNRYTKKHNDEFDHFGKYIAALLRQLPKEASSQLQADFVKQIMSVKKRDSDIHEFVAVDDRFGK